MDIITDEEIEQLVRERGLTIERVINCVVDLNGIIGVGLISLAQTIYLYAVLNPQLRVEGITQEEIVKTIENYKQKHYSNAQN